MCENKINIFAKDLSILSQILQKNSHFSCSHRLPLENVSKFDFLVFLVMEMDKTANGLNYKFELKTLSFILKTT